MMYACVSTCMFVSLCMPACLPHMRFFEVVHVGVPCVCVYGKLSVCPILPVCMCVCMYVRVAVCQYVLCLVGMAVCMPSNLDIWICYTCMHDIVCGGVACLCARRDVCLSVAPVSQLVRHAGSQFVCMPVCVYLSFSVLLTARMYVWLPVCMSGVCLAVSACMYVYMCYVCMSLCLYVCVSVIISGWVSVFASVCRFQPAIVYGCVVCMYVRCIPVGRYV